MSQIGDEAINAENTPESDENSSHPYNPDDILAEEESSPSSLFSERRNHRIYISKELVRKVIKLGVPDDSGSVGRVVSEVADRAISLGIGWLPDLTDAVAIQKGIADRMQEMTVIHLRLARILTDLESAAEYKTILSTFKNIAQEKVTR